MSLPKSWLEVGIGGVAAELLEQELRLEDVDAHRGERQVGLVRAWPADPSASRRSSMMRSLCVDMHDAEAGRLHARHLEAADGHVGAGVDMLLEHQLVVHLVDVVAGEDDDDSAGRSSR